MKNFIYADNVSTTLAAAISNSSTTINLSSSANLPTLASGDIFAITLSDAATRTYFEVCHVTAITGSALTVIRGQDGTSARAWSVGDLAYGALTTGELTQASTLLYGPKYLSFFQSNVGALDGQIVFADGETAANDGFQGNFYWNASSTTTADNVNVIQITGVSTGRWLRMGSQQVLSGINNQTGTSYTLVLSDAGKDVICTNASAVTLTVPPASSVAFPTGACLLFSQGGAGTVTATAGAGVTLQAANGAATSAQYDVRGLEYIGNDTWRVL